jgi:hypothetical protein
VGICDEPAHRGVTRQPPASSALITPASSVAPPVRPCKAARSTCTSRCGVAHRPRPAGRRSPGSPGGSAQRIGAALRRGAVIVAFCSAARRVHHRAKRGEHALPGLGVQTPVEANHPLDRGRGVQPTALVRAPGRVLCRFRVCQPLPVIDHPAQDADGAPGPGRAPRRSERSARDRPAWPRRASLPEPGRRGREGPVRPRRRSPNAASSCGRP